MSGAMRGRTSIVIHHGDFNYADASNAYKIFHLNENLIGYNRKVKSVLFNNPYTTIVWDDNTATVVKVADGEVYDEYMGFTAAYAKGMLGSGNEIKRIIKEKGVVK